MRWIVSRSLRFRWLVLFAAWLGAEPTIEPMLKYRGLLPGDEAK